MKKLFIPFLIALLLLAGCEIEIVSKEEAENARYISKRPHSIEEILAVGEHLVAEKVALNDGYSIMYETSEGNLQWFRLINEGGVAYTVKKSEKDYSYLVREKNLVEEGSLEGHFLPRKNVVTLYLNMSELNGASYTKNCGKNCNREINVEILD